MRLRQNRPELRLCLLYPHPRELATATLAGAAASDGYSIDAGRRKMVFKRSRTELKEKAWGPMLGYRARRRSEVMGSAGGSPLPCLSSP